MDIGTWLGFLAASTALLLIPGPTVLLVLAYALGQGRRVAVPTALGVATGDLLAMTVSVLGLGAIVLASATAFSLLKWAGAIYLVWLGIRMLWATRAAKSPDAQSLPTQPKALSARSAFSNAAIVTALNPKSIAFFIAFVPQFIDPERAFLQQGVVLIATFVALAALNALVYALAAAHLRDAIRKPAVLTGLTRVGGATLIAMGVATASLKRAIG